jgi:hypothetical protein
LHGRSISSLKFRMKLVMRLALFYSTTLSQDSVIVTDYAFDDVPSFGIVWHTFVDLKVK